LRYLKKVKTFLSIRKKYDVFHFNFGTTILHRDGQAFFTLFDLPFYPKKAKLFVTYNGCDARQKYPTMKRSKIASCHSSKCYGGVCNSGERDLERRKCIEKMGRYVKHMWALNPDLLYFLPPEKSSFLPYTIHDADVERVSPKFGKTLKIVHAPTNREAKGSRYIINAIEELKKKYPKSFELVLVEGISHQRALEIYQSADIVIDQLLIGWYGAFAVETMLMGKPVVARIAVEDLKFIPGDMARDVLQAVINANPFNICAVLEKCLHDRGFLKRRAQASLEYANKWHHPQYVAGLTKEKYEQEY
jgi:hypothetical protein